MKPDMYEAGRAYFLAGVMIVLLIPAQSVVLASGLGRLRLYQLYIAAMAFFMLVPVITLANDISPEFLRFNNPGLRVSLMCVLAALFAAFMNAHLGNIIYEGLRLTGLKPLSNIMPDASDAVEVCVYIFYAVIAAAVCEETVMRGVVLTALRSRGAWRAITVSAALFALLHGRIEALAQSFAVGIILGYVFVASDSIFSSIIIHMAYNAFVIALSYLPAEWAEALFGGGIWHSVVCVGISLAVITALLAAVRVNGKGGFESGVWERAGTKDIILMAAGITTMVCLTAINLTLGFM